MFPSVYLVLNVWQDAWCGTGHKLGDPQLLVALPDPAVGSAGSALGLIPARIGARHCSTRAPVLTSGCNLTTRQQTFFTRILGQLTLKDRHCDFVPVVILVSPDVLLHFLLRNESDGRLLFPLLGKASLRGHGQAATWPDGSCIVSKHRIMAFSSALAVFGRFKERKSGKEGRGSGGLCEWCRNSRPGS